MHILVIGDLHFPFSHFRATQMLWRRIQTVKFSHVIQIGDLLDQYSFTRFTKRNIFMPDREIKDGREDAQNMWKCIQKEQPLAKCIQLLGNHDMRILKRAQEKFPEGQEIVHDSLMELYEFDGVLTGKNPRDEYKIRDTAFLHGYKSQLGAHTRFMLGWNTVHGHTHRGGVAYIPVNDKTMWELDVGWLGDKDKVPFEYRDQTTTNWTLGWGEVELINNTLCPRFIPINL